MQGIDTMHPDNFEGKTGIISTVMLSSSSVLSLPPCLIPQSNTGTGVHNDGLLDDETIFVETCYVPAGVSKGDLIDLIG
eukprot:12810677-Ditylum_brightwellii.AAC.1